MFDFLPSTAVFSSTALRRRVRASVHQRTGTQQALPELVTIQSGVQLAAAGVSGPLSVEWLSSSEDGEEKLGDRDHEGAEPVGEGIAEPIVDSATTRPASEKLTQSQAMFTMVNTVVGAILLAIPFAFHYAGAVGGVLVLLIVTSVLAYTARVLGILLVHLRGEDAEHASARVVGEDEEGPVVARGVGDEQQDLGWIALQAFGPTGQHVVAIVFGTELFLGALSFLVLIAINMDVFAADWARLFGAEAWFLGGGSGSDRDPIIPGGGGTIPPPKGPHNVSLAAVLVGGVVSSLLSVWLTLQPRNCMALLAVASKFSVVAMVGSVFELLMGGLYGIFVYVPPPFLEAEKGAPSLTGGSSVLSVSSGSIAAAGATIDPFDWRTPSGQPPINTGVAPDRTTWSYSLVDPATIPLALGTMLFAYAGHPCFPQIYHAMERPEQEYGPACSRAFALAFAIYAVVGLVGYLLYPFTVQPSFVTDLGAVPLQQCAEVGPWSASGSSSVSVDGTQHSIHVSREQPRGDSFPSSSLSSDGGVRRVSSLVEPPPNCAPTPMNGAVWTVLRGFCSLTLSVKLFVVFPLLMEPVLSAFYLLLDVVLAAMPFSTTGRSAGALPELKTSLPRMFSRSERVLQRMAAGGVCTLLAYALRNQLPIVSAVAGGLLTMGSSVLAPVLCNLRIRGGCGAGGACGGPAGSGAEGGSFGTRERIWNYFCVVFGLLGMVASTGAALLKLFE